MKNPAVQKARALLRAAAAEAAAPRHRGRGVRGLWSSRPECSPEELLRCVEEAEKAPETRIIKNGKTIRVMRARLFDRETLIKRYDLASPLTRLKYRLRLSRGQRAWLAGRVLTELALPTPEPYGFLELSRGGWPIRSYLFCQFMDDARDARQWLKPCYARQPDAVRRAVREELAALFLETYQKRVYHADTKSSNLLLRAPLDPECRAFFWIDLECVRIGCRPTRRRIIRNLVQFNGSLGARISREDRLAFLHTLAQSFPWLEDPAVERRIRQWTLRRLKREIKREARP